MAGSITVSSITLDSDNNFSILSNTGAVLVSANGSGLLTGVANTSLSNKTITNPTVSGNLSLDSIGTSGIRLPAANTLAFHTAGAEDMRITSAGDVGIGTSSPSSYGPAGSRLAVVNTTSGQVCNMSIVNNSTDLYEGGGLLLGNSGLTANYDATYLYHHKFDNTGNDYSAFNISQRTVAGTYVANIWNVDYKNNVQTWHRPNTGAAVMQVDASANFQFNSGYGSVATAYGCRAWVNFNGTGTVAIRASGNVSSITDEGTSNYTVNFSTAMPNANYAVCGIGYHLENATEGPTVVFQGFQTSGSVRVQYRGNAGSPDPQTMQVAIFR
jgi:hypothetical protein